MPENFKDIFEALQEPFPSAAIEWRVTATSRDKSKALASPYVDVREYIQRLNEVLGVSGWSDSFRIETFGNRLFVFCMLQVNFDGTTITHEGDGEVVAEKGDDYQDENLLTTASAQAFKRACVKFGIGSYLYKIPQSWCSYDPVTKKLLETPKLPLWALPKQEREARKAVKPVTQFQPVPQADPVPQSQPVSQADPVPQSQPVTQADPVPQSETGIKTNFVVVIPSGICAGKTIPEAFQVKPGYVRYLAKNMTPTSDEWRAVQEEARAFLSTIE